MVNSGNYQNQARFDALYHPRKTQARKPMVEGHKMPMTILANSAVYRPDKAASAPMQRPCTYPTGHVHFSFRNAANK